MISQTEPTPGALVNNVLGAIPIMRKQDTKKDYSGFIMELRQTLNERTFVSFPACNLCAKYGLNQSLIKYMGKKGFVEIQGKPGTKIMSYRLTPKAKAELTVMYLFRMDDELRLETNRIQMEKRHQEKAEGAKKPVVTVTSASPAASAVRPSQSVSTLELIVPPLEKPLPAFDFDLGKAFSKTLALEWAVDGNRFAVDVRISCPPEADAKQVLQKALQLLDMGM